MLKRRLLYWLRRDAEARELEEEMAFHRAQSPQAFGNTLRQSEASRAVWIPEVLDGAWSDVRHAVRGLRKSPPFALTAVGTLALALGFGAAIVMLAREVMWRTLPYDDPQRLMLVFEGSVDGVASPRGDLSPANYRDLAARLKTLRGLSLMANFEANVDDGDEPERLDGAAVTTEFFTTVGVRPLLGRFFQAHEGDLGNDQVVVLSHELWQRRYASDRRVIGRQIRMNEKPYTVIGVLPPGFRYCFHRPEIWRPFAVPAETWARRASRYVWVTGRLSDGATLASARAELSAAAELLRREYPRENSLLKLTAVPIHEYLVEGARSSLWFLLAAAAALLLIACSNVAHLLLTRSVVRGAEFAVRRALGASSWRLGQHLFMEALALAAAAAILAMPVAAGALIILQALVPDGMVAFTPLRFNWWTALTVVALALLAAIAAGLIPAFRSAQPLNTRAIGGRGQDRLRGALIVGEVALALMLLTGAALLFQTFLNLQNRHPGFVAEKLISAQTWLPPALQKDAERRTQFYHEVLERVRAIPGVTHATYATTIPTAWKGGLSSFNAEGVPYRPGTFAAMRLATADYFATLGIRVRAGRGFTPEDRANAEKVVVVNEAFARRVWPGEDPLNKRIRRGDPQSAGAWIRVVGVVEDVHELGLEREAPITTYFPESQHPTASFAMPIYVLARADRPIGGELRQAVLAVNPRQTVAKLLPVTAVLDQEVARQRLRSMISAAFAVLALALACFGLYGVLSYGVASRGREFGVRLALGATRGGIARMVLGEGLRLALAGIVIGLAGAWGLARFMEGLLFGIQPRDPGAMALVAFALLATALLASWAPARRAVRIEPARALRGE